MSRTRPAKRTLDERECSWKGEDGSTSSSEFEACCCKTLYSEEAMDEVSVGEPRSIKEGEIGSKICGSLSFL